MVGYHCGALETLLSEFGSTIPRPYSPCAISRVALQDGPRSATVCLPKIARLTSSTLAPAASFYSNNANDCQRGTMKIKIIETEKRHLEGTMEPPEYDQFPTGREWEIDIPVESCSIKEVWKDIKGDVRELIQLAKNSLR